MRNSFFTILTVAILCSSVNCSGSLDSLESANDVEEVSVGDKKIPPASKIVFQADDWPWWRGPTFDGKANGAGKQGGTAYPTEWSSTKNVIWKTKVPGMGHASPTVVGNRIFLATADATKQVQSVICYNRKTGQQMWRSDVHQGKLGKSTGHRDSTYASATVACDGTRLFAVFRNNGKIMVTALDLNGKKVWQIDAGAHTSQFGYGSSPLIYKSLVIVAADSKRNGFLIALHRNSGKTVWKKKRLSAPAYSSPVVAHVSGKDQLLLSGGKKIISFNPLTGDEFWSCDGCASVTCGTMVWSKDTVFASGGFSGSETVAVKADGSAKVVWRNRGMNFYVPSMIFHDGCLYGITNGGLLHCLDAKNGKKHWRKRIGGNYYPSPILVGKQLYFTSREGKVTVVELNSKEYKSVGTNQLGKYADATPVPCGGRFYIRVAEMNGKKRQETLYCIGTKK